MAKETKAVFGGSAEIRRSLLLKKEELENTEPEAEELVESEAESFNLPEHGQILEEIERQMQRLPELKSAIINIPVLFDTNSFNELIEHLELLEEAGVKKIKTIGTSGEDSVKEMSIKKIKELVEEVRDEYSASKIQTSIAEGIISDKNIMSILGDKGITRNKIISEHSTQGFRECLFNCIKALTSSSETAGRISREETEENEEESRTKIRRAIEDM